MGAVGSFGGGGGSGEPVLATPLWGMLYADDAVVVVSQSPEQPREENDEGDHGRVRGVWPHRMGGQD